MAYSTAPARTTDAPRAQGEINESGWLFRPLHVTTPLVVEPLAAG